MNIKLRMYLSAFLHRPIQVGGKAVAIEKGTTRAMFTYAAEVQSGPGSHRSTHSAELGTS